MNVGPGEPVPGPRCAGPPRSRVHRSPSVATDCVGASPVPIAPEHFRTFQIVAKDDPASLAHVPDTPGNDRAGCTVTHMTQDDPKHSGTAKSEACTNGWLPPQDDFVEVTPHVRLHIRDWGQGKSIVFVHGWPLCNEMFEYQFTQLAQQFRCVAPSLRGFGRSSQPWGGYDLDVFADDLRSVLEALGLQDVVLAGFGMGGAVALRYMGRHQGYRVSKLALLAAAAPIWPRDCDFPKGCAEVSPVERLVELGEADRARLVAETIGKFFHTDCASSASLAAWLFHLAMGASPKAVVASLHILGQADLRADIATVSVATLILHGCHDKLVPFAVGEALARGIRGSQLVSLDESGHALFWEERKKVNAELARFVG